jgi:xanthine dehydrogenase accessory factor
VTDVIVRAGELAARGRHYALATVVKVVRPASARPGDRAIVLPDGSLEGWVGGACSEPTVVSAALEALRDGEPRLVRVEDTCASRGEVEIFVEPCLPAPLLCVVGDSPAGATLVRLAEEIGWRVSGEVAEEADAVVVASMGRGDEAALTAALATGARYIGLVASTRRASTVMAGLREQGVGEEALARVHSPAGLDLGPSRQEEIAVAILAQLIAWRHTESAPAAPPPPAEKHSCHEA